MDGPPGFKRLVLTHIKCTLTHWFITADGPVFEPRTVRDFAEKSVTASFLGDVYIYPIPGHWVSLGHLDCILDTIELRHSSLTHLIRDCILENVRAS